VSATRFSQISSCCCDTRMSCQRMKTKWTLSINISRTSVRNSSWHRSVSVTCCLSTHGGLKNTRHSQPQSVPRYLCWYHNYTRFWPIIKILSSWDCAVTG